MRKDSGIVFEGGIEFAAEVVSEGDFFRLSLAVEVSEGKPSWDLAGVDEVLFETGCYDAIARTQDVQVYRLDPDAFDNGEIRDGTLDSRVVLVKAELPIFTGYVREATLYVRGGARFGSGHVAAIQRFPRVWVSENFNFCTNFTIDMRG